MTLSNSDETYDEFSSRPKRKLNPKSYSEVYSSEESENDKEVVTKKKKQEFKIPSEKPIQKKKKNLSKESEEVLSCDYYERIIQSDMNQIPVLVKQALHSIDPKIEAGQLDILLLIIKSTSVEYPTFDAFLELKIELTDLLKECIETDGNYDINFSDFISTFILGDGVRDQKINCESGFGASTKKSYSKFKEKYSVFLTKFFQQLLKNSGASILPFISFVSDLTIAFSLNEVKTIREVGTISSLVLMKQIILFQDSASDPSFANDTKKKIFDFVLVNRFRDTFTEVRLDCLYFLRDLMLNSKEVVSFEYLTADNLRFLAQSLVDKNELVRKVCIQTVASLLEKNLDGKRNHVRLFIENSKKRLLEIMAFDSSKDNRSLGRKSLLCLLSERGYLTLKEDGSDVGLSEFSLLSMCLYDEIKNELLEKKKLTAQVMLQIFLQEYSSSPDYSTVGLVVFLQFLKNTWEKIDSYFSTVESTHQSLFKDEQPVIQSDSHLKIKEKLVDHFCFNVEFYFKESQLNQVLTDFGEYYSFATESVEDKELNEFFLSVLVQLSGDFGARDCAIRGLKIDTKYLDSLLMLDVENKDLLYKAVGSLLNTLKESTDDLIDYMISNRWFNCVDELEADLMFKYIFSQKKIMKNKLHINIIESKIKEYQSKSDNDCISKKLPISCLSYGKDSNKTFETELRKYSSPSFDIEKFEIGDFLRCFRKYLSCGQSVDHQLCIDLIMFLKCRIENLNENLNTETCKESEEEHLLKDYRFIFRRFDQKKLLFFHEIYEDLSCLIEDLFKNIQKESFPIEELLKTIIVEFFPNLIYNTSLKDENISECLPEDEINNRHYFYAEFNQNWLELALFRKYLNPFERKEMSQFILDIFRKLGKLFILKLSKYSLTHQVIIKYLKLLITIKLITFGTKTGSLWFGSAIDFLLDEYVRKLVSAMKASDPNSETTFKVTRILIDFFYEVLVLLLESFVVIDFHSTESGFEVLKLFEVYLVSKFGSEDIFKISISKAIEKFINLNYINYSSTHDRMNEKGIIAKEFLEQLQETRMKNVSLFCENVCEKMRCTETERILALLGFNLMLNNDDDVDDKKEKQRNTKRERKKQKKAMNNENSSPLSNYQLHNKLSSTLSDHSLRRSNRLRSSEVTGYSDEFNEEDEEQECLDLKEMEYNSSPEIKRFSKQDN